MIFYSIFETPKNKQFSLRIFPDHPSYYRAAEIVHFSVQ